MPTVAQQFAQTLQKIGARYVFGVPSGNMIDYIEALRNEDGIDFILVGHEATAAIMADICGRLTGTPGVCFATFGPGATNLSTGVGGALLDRSPLIAFTDEMPDHLLKRTVQMNIDHQKLFKPITKSTKRLQKGRVAKTILKAARKAVSEVPGSVHIGVPAGIGREEVEGHFFGFDKVLEKKKDNFYISKGTNTELSALLEKSKKPLLAVGLSAVRAGVKSQIIAFAEKFQVPVVLTPMAKGMFPENHALYAGVLFHALSNEVEETYKQADTVFAVGYDPVEFNYEDWMPSQAVLVHLDTEKADIEKGGKYFCIDVVADLTSSLNELLKMEKSVYEWDLEQLVERKNKMIGKFKPTENSFGPLAVVEGLRKALPDEGILTVDVGAHLHLIGQMWPTPEPQKLLMTNGWSSMGFAQPAALAAKLCNPDLPVAAIMGDGGFLMAVGELATALRLNLKIVFVVIYDQSLSLIRIKQNKKDFDPHYGTDLNLLPQTPTNHYFGVPVIRATNAVEYQNALAEAFSANGPTVIEAVVDGGEYNDLVLKPNKS